MGVYFAALGIALAVWLVVAVVKTVLRVREYERENLRRITNRRV
jgi:hypothetical protein